MHIAGETGVGAADADVDDRGARLHHVSRDQMRYARCRDDDVGALHLGGEIARAGVTQGDRRVLAATGQQQADRPADGDAAPDHSDVGSVERDVVSTEEMDHAARGAGQRGLLAEHQAAEVDRMEAVGVLLRGDALERGILVEVFGERELHDVPGACRVGVQVVDGGVELLCGRIRGEILADRGDADLGAVGVLAPDVRLRAGVVADQYRAQAWRDASCREPSHAGAEIGEDLIAGEFAVQSNRRHGLPLFHSTPPPRTSSAATPAVRDGSMRKTYQQSAWLVSSRSWRS